MSNSKTFKAIKAPSSLLKGDLVLLSLCEDQREELVVFLEYSRTPERKAGIKNCRVMAVKLTDTDGYTYADCGEIMDDWGFTPDDQNFLVLSRFEE